jgi:hypothetical protein
MPMRVRRSLARTCVLGMASLGVAGLAPVAAWAGRGESGRRARHETSSTPAQAPAGAPGETSGTPPPGEADGTPPSGEANGSPPSGESDPRPAGRRAGRGGKCHLSVAASSPLVAAGETVTLSGELLCPSDRTAAGEALTVYVRERGGASGPQEAGTATTEADGSYQFTSTALETNSVFYVRAQGSFSAHTLVRVAPKVTLTAAPADAQTSTVGGHPGRRTWLTFTGTVSPDVAGAHVTLQREYTALGERWRTIAVAVVGPEGEYSFTHSFRAAGEMSVRAVVHSRRTDVQAASEPLSYDLPQAQNPRLTIQGSGEVVSAGQSVTITGVAAGAPDAPITLLARTRGHAFTVLAKGTTDEEGAYTFTESPQQSAFYRVIDAGAASTELFEGFQPVLTASLSPGTEQAGKLLAQAGMQVTFAGTLVPARPGQAVYLEREQLSGVGFQVIAAGTVGSDSSYSIGYTFSEPGTCIVRVRAPGNAEAESTVSEPFTILTTDAAPSDPQGPSPPGSPAAHA